MVLMRTISVARERSYTNCIVMEGFIDGIWTLVQVTTLDTYAGNYGGYMNNNA
ncbi:hypothetical protein BgiMline_001827, partial [Biomphalaria glabrata]